jgi:thiamine-monophosphate kinase
MVTAVSEFDLIRRYFTRPVRHTTLGIGDDAALFAPAPGQELAVSTDLLVEGTHFFANAEPEALGWKTLAVNVSDLAAMGATPRWATLALALPAADADWLDAYTRGFFACAERFGIDLIGGDTTRGPVRTFCVTIMGEVPVGHALRRSGANPGDSIWVSGTPGRAPLGLAHLRGETTVAESKRVDYLNALHRPQPRVELGLALRGLATAAIDVSDGLLADLGHILEQSNAGADLCIPGLPTTDIERKALLTGGDDYELAFTTPAGRDAEVAALSERLHLPLTRIGAITPGGRDDRLKLCDDKGHPIPLPTRLGYDHFDNHG